MFTVCVECAHFWNSAAGTPRAKYYSNHFCKASLLPKKRDPVTGEMLPYKGGFVPDEYHFCRDVNKGNCTLWIPIKGDESK